MIASLNKCAKSRVIFSSSDAKAKKSIIIIIKNKGNEIKVYHFPTHCSEETHSP